jgi:cytochrome o ubiquinol oxidase operon protein cyoD
MSAHDAMEAERGDAAPGEQDFGEHGVAAGIRNYLIGLALAAGLTIGSFWVASDSGLIYTPGIPMALAALAVAQMGVHLAFFLHITTGPDNANNALALAFGALIVGIVIAGSLWIMYHLNANMMVPGDMMDMRMQR